MTTGTTPAPDCTGRTDCAAGLHTHGCYADDGRCTEPADRLAHSRRAGDRVTDGGVTGVLVTCENCSGDGLLLQEDPSQRGQGPAPTDGSPAPGPCPHCDPGQHLGGSWRPAWGVYVAPDRDADGQPTHLVVQPTAGAHVAQEDADWLWTLIQHEADIKSQLRHPTPTQAAHVLWHYGDHVYGMEPGSFTKHLISALAAADPFHRARLGIAYPGYALAVHHAANELTGMRLLVELAGDLRRAPGGDGNV